MDIKIEYDGEYPNLCAGKLIVTVDGIRWNFPPYCVERRRFKQAVTDVPCPCCDGSVQWAEAGYVPGYRICDGCGRHFMAKGNADEPCLVEVPNRRGGLNGC